MCGVIKRIPCHKSVQGLHTEHVLMLFLHEEMCKALLTKDIILSKQRQVVM